MKRILFFHHYDIDDIIDDYIIYFLRAFKDAGCDIRLGSNSKLAKDELSKLDGIVDTVLLRENRGYDFASWRDQLLTFGRERLGDYDQVIIANSTAYGPLFDLVELFERLDRQKFDFWTPTMHSAAYGFPGHVQPYVLIINKDLHKSDTFWNFWESIQDDYKDPYDVIWRAEIRMTREFCLAGFTYAVEADMADLREIRELGHYEPFLMHAAAYLVNRKKLPFVKVKSFYRLDSRPLQQTHLIFDALKKTRSTYPTDLIINHQKRISPLSWHKNLPGTMKLTGLSTDAEDSAEKSAATIKIGVFAHLFYSDNFYDSVQYIQNIPYPFDLNVTTPNLDVKALLEQKVRQDLPQLLDLDIRIVENRGRDIAPWILEFRDKHFDYDIALKLHVKKHSQQPDVFSYMWNDFMFESLLASPEHVRSVLKEFCCEPKLGMAFASYPPFYNLIYPRGYWGSAEDIKWRKKILNHLTCDIPEETSQPIFPVGGMSWYRPKALKRLFQSDYVLEDFPHEPFPTSGTIGHGLERAIPYIAQSEGYEYRILMPVDLLRRSFLLYEDRIMSTYLPARLSQAGNGSMEMAPPGIKQSTGILLEAIKRSFRKRSRLLFCRIMNRVPWR